MKKSLLLFSAVFLMAFSCEKEELTYNQVSACAVANPLQNLPWLKAEVENREKYSSEKIQYAIMQGEYQGETVFYTRTCCPTCNFMPPVVFNCQGEEVFHMEPGTSQDNRIKNDKVIWKGPPARDCNL